MILEVDEEKRRISLGLKQLSENPWQVFEHTHKEGDRVLIEQVVWHHVENYMIIDQEKVIAVIPKDTKIGR